MEGLKGGSFGWQHQGEGPRPSLLGHRQPLLAPRPPQHAMQLLQVCAHQDQGLVGGSLLQAPELGGLGGAGRQGRQGVGGEQRRLASGQPQRQILGPQPPLQAKGTHGCSPSSPAAGGRRAAAKRWMPSKSG